MKIEIIPCLNDNYSYLIKDDQTDTVAIIDPSEFGPCDKKINQNLKITMVHGSKDNSVPVVYSKKILKIFKTGKKNKTNKFYRI